MGKSEEAHDSPVLYSHVARAGILFLALPAIDGSNAPAGRLPKPKVFVARILEALDADTRVKYLSPKVGDEISVSTQHVAMAGSSLAKNDVPPPHRHIHVAKFAEPIVMKVNIPRRLQNQERGPAAIPAEDYLVAWDGMELLVLWDHDQSKRPSGYFGGFAVLDVINDAVAKVGLETRREPCGPNCDFPFAHTDMMLLPDESISDLVLSPLERGVVEARFPVTDSETKLARALAERLGFTIRTFARMRAFGTTVIASENQARREVGDLLMMQYKRANAAALGIFGSIPTRIRNHGMPRKMSLLTAGLWLRLATLEQNRRSWGEVRHVYDTSVSASGYGVLFGIEYPQEVNSVQGLEVGSLRSAVEQMTLRADTRVVALSTLSGAIAGGIIAGILSVIVAIAGGGAT